MVRLVATPPPVLSSSPGLEPGMVRLAATPPPVLSSSPGFEPGMVRLAATPPPVPPAKPPALSRGWFGWLLLLRPPAAEVFLHLRCRQLAVAADIRAGLPHPRPQECLRKPLRQQALALVHKRHHQPRRRPCRMQPQSHMHVIRNKRHLPQGKALLAL